MAEDVFPELLAGAGLAARFVAEPYIWDQFVEWCLDEGLLLPDEPPMSRELMLRSSLAMKSVIRQIEIQLLSAKISASLHDLNDPGQ